MNIVLKNIAFLRVPRNVRNFCTRWARMDGDCWLQWQPIPAVSGCFPSLRLIRMPRVWKQDYLPPDKGGTWIPDEDRLPSAQLYFSPYDLDASAGTSRSTHWIGNTSAF